VAGAERPPQANSGNGQRERCAVATCCWKVNLPAVFSASSIAWGSALPCNNFENDVSGVMKNVLDAFARPGKLPGADRTT
jgi:hypothetical protein